MSTPLTILLVDDNAQVARAIGFAFECAGHRLDVAGSPEEAYSRLADETYDAILLDLNFTAGMTSGEEGFVCLSRILADDPRTVLVVITAHSGVRIAVAAMRAGASDFVMKPWRNADLVARVETAVTQRARPRAALDANGGPAGGTGALRLIGDSAALVRIRDLISRIGPTSASVTICGPAGSGRSLAAQALHEASARAERGLVTIDVRDLAAWSRMREPMGTLILRYPDTLDEIAQFRLSEKLPPEARLISIVDGERSLIPRLHGRLATVELTMPPLGNRGDDALLLARHFARIAAERHGRDLPMFTASAEARILATAWEDEVRGLAQTIERAVLLDEDGVIDMEAIGCRPVEAMEAPGSVATAAPDFRLWDSERVMIEAALRHHGHNVAQAAATLGLSRQALYRRMERHGL